MTGDLLGMEGSARISRRTAERPSLHELGGVIDEPDVRVTLARHDPDAGLLGPMRARSVAVGQLRAADRAERDARQPDTATASWSATGRSTSRRASTGTPSAATWPPGWDVTLYYNDALIGYQTARSDGQYAFEDLPLSFGPNEFRLVFNGPLGQVRVERQSFLLDQSVIAPGEVLLFRRRSIAPTSAASARWRRSTSA